MGNSIPEFESWMCLKARRTGVRTTVPGTIVSRHLGAHLKPPVHHSTIVLRGPLIASHYAERLVSRTANVRE